MYARAAARRGEILFSARRRRRRARKSLMGMAERNSLRSVVRKAAVSAGSRWFSGRPAGLGQKAEAMLGAARQQPLSFAKRQVEGSAVVIDVGFAICWVSFRCFCL